MIHLLIPTGRECMSACIRTTVEAGKGKAEKRELSGDTDNV